jgi:hypothetical protein
VLVTSEDGTLVALDDGKESDAFVLVDAMGKMELGKWLSNGVMLFTHYMWCKGWLPGDW